MYVAQCDFRINLHSLFLIVLLILCSTTTNILQATLNKANVTTIRGDGVLLHSGEVVVQGGLSLGTAESEVLQGGAQVSSSSVV